MDIDKILLGIAEQIGKRKGDLKRSYNSIEKKKKEEGVDQVLPPDNFQRLILLGVCNKYDFSIEDLDALLSDTPVEEEEEEDDVVEFEEDDFDLEDELDEIEFEEEETSKPYVPRAVEAIMEFTGLTQKEIGDLIEIKKAELKGLISEEGALFVIGKELGVNVPDDIIETDDDFEFEEDLDDMGEEDSWESIFAKTPPPKTYSEGGQFERLPTLTIVSGTEYFLKLVNPKEMPYTHHGIGEHDDKPYTSRAMDVILLKVKPESRYKLRYQKGDNRGDKCFVNKQKYKLWMSETAFSWFAQFWEQEVGLSAPDGRIWTFEQLKQENVTKYFFGEYNKK